MEGIRVWAEWNENVGVVFSIPVKVNVIPNTMVYSSSYSSYSARYHLCDVAGP